MATGDLNLTMTRGQPGIWDGSTGLLDRADGERLLVGAAGTALAIAGLSRRSIGGALLAAAGGALAWRAWLGHHDASCLRAWLDDRLVESGWRARDVVDEASAESFPASDAPGWTAG